MDFAIGYIVGMIVASLIWRNLLKQQEGYTEYWYENSRSWMEQALGWKDDGS